MTFHIVRRNRLRQTCRIIEQSADAERPSVAKSPSAHISVMSAIAAVACNSRKVINPSSGSCWPRRVFDFGRRVRGSTAICSRPPSRHRSITSTTIPCNVACAAEPSIGNGRAPGTTCLIRLGTSFQNYHTSTASVQKRWIADRLADTESDATRSCHKPSRHGSRNFPWAPTAPPISNRPPRIG